MAGGRCCAACTRSAARVHGVKVVISGRSAPTPQILPLQMQVTGDPCQTFDCILLVGWLVCWPHIIGQREGLGYVFDYAIDHQNSRSFGAIWKGAHGYLRDLYLLEFSTFCCLLFVVVGFFFCIQLPFFLVCWKTYSCSSKNQFTFNCRGLTSVLSRFCDLTEYASCINNVPGAIMCPLWPGPCPAPSFMTSSAWMLIAHIPPPPSCFAGPLDGWRAVWRNLY